MREGTAGAERDAFRCVKRACYAGLDSVTLRQEVARRAARVLPSEALAIATADPDTGLMTHTVRDGIPPGFVREFLRVIYPYHEAQLMLDLARSGRVVSADSSPAFKSVMRSVGLEHELRATLSVGPSLWGIWCSLREAGSCSFGDREAAFLRRIAPHIAQGLRAAALLAAGSAADGPAGHGGRPERAPGVVVIDAGGRITLRTAAATDHLTDIADVGEATDLPLAVASVVGCVRDPVRYARTALDDDRPLGGCLRVRGRSGRWYTLRASLAEPDALGESAVVVIIAPVERGEVASLLAHLYGLSPREREVLSFVARGHSTRDIAARLGLSPYTVQDHLDHAFDKVGVRGRRALLAKLFFDGYARAFTPS